MAKPMTFEQARKALPGTVLLNLDPMTHTTVDDLAFIAQFELDLYEEGEPTEIKTAAQANAVRRYIAKCKGN